MKTGTKAIVCLLFFVSIFALLVILTDQNFVGYSQGKGNWVAETFTQLGSPVATMFLTNQYGETCASCSIVISNGEFIWSVTERYWTDTGTTQTTINSEQTMIVIQANVIHSEVKQTEGESQSRFVVAGLFSVLTLTIAATIMFTPKENSILHNRKANEK